MLERFWTFASGHIAAACSLVREHAYARRVAGAAQAILPEPALLRPQESWLRATGPITAALAGFERIQSCHAEATSQIDAADYALRRLIAELGTVLPIPADGSELRALLATIEEPPEADAEVILAA